MHSFRRTWLALMGAILLVTLSVSAAFGAKPSTDGPRGQSVAAFVHDLVFGDETDEETDEDPAEDEDSEDEDSDEDPAEEEDSEDEDSEDEDSEESEEDSERQVPEEFANHGECVSAAAADSEGFEESDAKNKGEWVSMHARYVCWGLEVPGEDSDEDATSEDVEDADELSAKEQRKADKAAAKAERKSARLAAKAAKKGN